MRDVNGRLWTIGEVKVYRAGLTNRPETCEMGQDRKDALYALMTGGKCDGYEFVAWREGIGNVRVYVGDVAWRTMVDETENQWPRIIEAARRVVSARACGEGVGPGGFRIMWDLFDKPCGDFYTFQDLVTETAAMIIADEIEEDAERRKALRYRIVTHHGEGRSVFNVVDDDAPEDEQPAVVAGFEQRAEAILYIRDRGGVV